jgi:opacity protein-like surface antigen
MGQRRLQWTYDSHNWSVDLRSGRLSDHDQDGLVAGGGAEWMINPHVMLGLEYLYYGLGDEALTGSIFPGRFLPVSFTWPNSNVQVARASLSYKF